MRSPAQIAAEKKAEAARNGRKVLVRLSQAEAEKLDAARREGESREAAIKRIIGARR